MLLEAAMVMGLIHLIDENINITGETLNISLVILDTIYWLFLAWAALLAGDALAEAIIASPKIDPRRNPCQPD